MSIVIERIQIVRVTNSCYNCHSIDHRVKYCKSKFSCRLYKQRYKTLLHKGSEPWKLVQNCDATQSRSTAVQSTIKFFHLKYDLLDTTREQTFQSISQ